MKHILATIIILLPLASFAIELSFPVDCKIGEECFIQKYVDMEKGEEFKDYQCGHLANDKHKGTDIRLRNYVEMNKGVDVLAAASGKVWAVRDGEEDISVLTNARYDPTRGCGNVVVLEHNDGYRTLYCHMKKDSIKVRKGLYVKKGHVLGQVGLSGNTQYPHLHFQLMKDNQPVDPFTQAGLESGCGQKEDSLWEKTPPYSQATILSMGVNDGKAEAENAREGMYDDTTIRPDSDAIVGWVDVMAPKAGDSIVITIEQPGGLKRNFATPIDKDKAQWFQFAGIKRTQPEWDSGTYTISAQLVRDTIPISEQQRTITISQ